MRFLRRGISLLVIMLWGTLIAAPTTQAQDLESALAGFTTDSFADTGAAVAAVAQSGNPLAIPLVEALQDGHLLFSAQQKRVYFRDRTGVVLDAATGNPASAAPGDLSPVRVNNRVRRAIDAVLAAEPVPAGQYPSLGCSIKWRPGNEPSYG